jgi:alpha-L-fucosidase
MIPINRRTTLKLITLSGLITRQGCSQGSRREPYAATWESLDRHRVPEWFEDAKFGMFIDWGIYSIAGWSPLPDQGPVYPDWYEFFMYTKYKDYHAKTWGANFQRDDFIPLFTAKSYDPDELAEMARRFGMRYIVPLSKHHDGFCLWPSKLTHRNAAEMGPRRDLLAPLVAACRRNDLKVGLYQSLEEWEYPIVQDNGKKTLRVWDHDHVFTVPYDAAAVKGKITGKIPVRDFVADYIVPQTEELIALYDPDILWFDGDWVNNAEYYHTQKLVAHFYNRAEGRKEVAVNDRLGLTRGRKGDFFTSEYGMADEKEFRVAELGHKHKWEECRGISQSFGYNRLDTEKNVISGDDLVAMLVRIVANNGNLLLVVNLDGGGALPEIERKRLEDLGRWLNVNGEAIYGTRKCTLTSPSQGKDVFFSASKDGRFVYAISLKWPGRELELESIRPRQGSHIRLLGTREPLEWKHNGTLTVSLPEGLEKARPCDHAWSFKIETG